MIVQKNFFSLFKISTVITCFCLTMTAKILPTNTHAQHRDEQALICISGDLLYNKNYEKNLSTFVTEVIKRADENDRIPDLIALNTLLSSRSLNIPLKLILDALVDAAHIIRIHYWGVGIGIDLERLAETLEHWCNFATKQMLSVNDTFYRNNQ